MPKFAHIAERVPCPKCGEDLAWNDRVGFQWGHCAYPWSDSSRPSYCIGDALSWRADVGGRVPAWRYFDDGTANVGDPREGDVLVRESEYDIRQCGRCGWAFGGIGVVIRAGLIEAVAAYPEWPSGAGVFVIGASGELIPRPDFYGPADGLGGPRRTASSASPDE